MPDMDKPVVSRELAAKRDTAHRSKGQTRGRFLLVERIRAGILSKEYAEIAGRVGISKSELARKLGISPRTISSRRGKRLTAQESEKMIRVEQILDEAESIFGSAAEAGTWINSPQRGLEFRKPIELLDTDVGAGYVRDYLSAIKYGNVW
jgi:putative toxin-antitoxin system antitoxin component (TIGR02293 family)